VFYCVTGGDHNCMQPAEYYGKLDAFLAGLSSAEHGVPSAE
jgi:hypothetical protein